MDSVQHAVDGFLITELFFVAAGVHGPLGGAFGGALVGVLPDALGFCEKVVKRDPNAWTWYNEAHTGKLSKVLEWIPQYGYHLFKDRHSHVSMGAARNWFPPPGLSFWASIRAMDVDWIGWATTGALAATIGAIRLWA
jgi:hypothetical protein